MIGNCVYFYCPFSLIHFISLLVLGEEVVDLTCEGSEPAVVDLTNNDSVVVSLFCSLTRRKSLQIHGFTFVMSINMPVWLILLNACICVFVFLSSPPFLLFNHADHRVKPRLWMMVINLLVQTVCPVLYM